MSSAKKGRKKSIPKKVRTEVWKKFNGNNLTGTCYACRKNIEFDDFDAGHIISEAHGGLVHVDNLRPICRACNTSCGTRNLEEFKQMLPHPPNNTFTSPNDGLQNRTLTDQSITIPYGNNPIPCHSIGLPTPFSVQNYSTGSVRMLFPPNGSTNRMTKNI